jgi:hypothetical protein
LTSRLAAKPSVAPTKVATAMTRAASAFKACLP